MNKCIVEYWGVDADVIGGGALQTENKRITNRLNKRLVIFLWQTHGRTSVNGKIYKIKNTYPLRIRKLFSYILKGCTIKQVN